jgi:hypothetical protein
VSALSSDLVSRNTNTYRPWLIVAAALVCALVLGACGGDDSTEGASQTTSDDSAAVASEDGVETSEGSEVAAGSPSFTAEVWADNWFALYVNGELVGEDSVPITTERSFNAETFTFQAEYPLTIAIEAKDFKETDSGIEYIGQPNQQMGDGGLIVQITDQATGEIIAATDDQWAALVVHRAPVNTGCEKDQDPDATCEFESIEAPADWASVGFDESLWSAATEWSEGDVGPKDGYDEISWNSAARLIWGSDLEVDNTILLRRTVSG